MTEAPPPLAAQASIVARAMTALNSAAAAAERALSDLNKPSSQGDVKVAESSVELDDRGHGEVQHEAKPSRWHPRRIGKNFKNMKKMKEEAEQKEKAELSSIQTREFMEKDLKNMRQRSASTNKNFLGDDGKMEWYLDALSAYALTLAPSSAIIKQLAVAMENSKKYSSLDDILASVKESDKPGLSFSAVKSLVLREKEDKSGLENFGDEETFSMIRTLFNAENYVPRGKNPLMACSLKDIRGAPPESLTVRISQIMGRLKSLRKMALLWRSIVMELRTLWLVGQPVPYVPTDDLPDLCYCLLHQQLQVINCCIARKKRKQTAIEELESEMEIAESGGSVSSGKAPSLNLNLYAKIITGDLLVRFGAVRQAKGLAMLETGEPVFSPRTQEPPLLTEDLVRENEEFVIRTGSMGAACSQLLSDMQAFKAANPGCILEDFIRWHSPPDWEETGLNCENSVLCDEDSSSRRGKLSSRMRKEGNLWRELWETAKSLPAVKQTPLFDEDLAVEGILSALEDISPYELFKQLFLSLICSGFAVAESTLPADSNLSQLFYDCKDYVNATCQGDLSPDVIDALCQVYESVETIINHPEEGLVILKQSSQNVTEPKGRFRKFSLNFPGKDKQANAKPPPKDQKKPSSNHMRVLSNLFDGKPSLFSTTTPKPKTELEAGVQQIEENDWTLV